MSDFRCPSLVAFVLKKEELKAKLEEEKKQIKSLKKEAINTIEKLSKLEILGTCEKVRALEFIEHFAKLAKLLR